MPMRMLVDEQLEGIVPMLRVAGCDVVSVKDEYPGEKDEKLVMMAKEHGWVFVTEDVRAAEIARFLSAKLIQIDLVLKAKAVLGEAKEMGEREKHG
jgi:uncharacterized protein with PIN domain